SLHCFAEGLPFWRPFAQSGRAGMVNWAGGSIQTAAQLLRRVNSHTEERVRWCAASVGASRGLSLPLCAAPARFEGDTLTKRTIVVRSYPCVSLVPSLR